MLPCLGVGMLRFQTHPSGKMGKTFSEHQRPYPDRVFGGNRTALFFPLFLWPFRGILILVPDTGHGNQIMLFHKQNWLWKAGGFGETHFSEMAPQWLHMHHSQLATFGRVPNMEKDAKSHYPTLQTLDLMHQTLEIPISAPHPRSQPPRYDLLLLHVFLGLPGVTFANGTEKSRSIGKC